MKRRILGTVAAALTALAVAAVGNANASGAFTAAGSDNLSQSEGGFELSGHLSSRYPEVNQEFVNVGWDKLEPTQGSFTGTGWSQIDHALATHPAGLKLRIESGITAPRWLDAISGPAVHACINGPNGLRCGDVPRFWNDAYWPQYSALIDQIYARYGSNPQITTITACGAMTVNCEPFIRSGADTASNKALYQAGLNQTTDKAAVLRSVQVAATQAPRWHVSLATHTTWQIVSAAGDRSAWSWPAERDLLQQLRATYGNDKLVIQNNGIGGSTSTWNGAPSQAPDLWAYIRNDPGRDGFQGGYKGFAGNTVLNHAVNDMHADFFENISGLTSAQVATYDKQMKANASLPH